MQFLHMKMTLFCINAIEYECIEIVCDCGMMIFIDVIVIDGDCGDRQYFIGLIVIISFNKNKEWIVEWSGWEMREE